MVEAVPPRLLRSSVKHLREFAGELFDSIERVEITLQIFQAVFCREDHTLTDSQIRAIAENVGRSVRTVRRVAQRLVSVGWLRRVRDPGQLEKRVGRPAAAYKLSYRAYAVARERAYRFWQIYEFGRDGALSDLGDITEDLERGDVEAEEQEDLWLEEDETGEEEWGEA